MIIRLPQVLIYLFSLLLSVASYASQTIEVDPVTGAKSWEGSSNGVTLYLKQLKVEQLKAYYSNRGFDLKQVDEYIHSCVYMTVLRNDTAPTSIYYQSKKWIINSANKSQTVRQTQNWLDSLELQGAKIPALIAFQWSQFPTESTYEPGGDWNQGMLSANSPTSKQFNVIAQWTMDNKEFQISLNGVECAD